MYSMLLVDDEAATRAGLVRLPLWRRLGIQRILEASDGEEALALMARERPDILLTDVKMPRMEGTVLARHARALYDDLKIVFFSGYDDIGYVKSALTVAAYDYIFKPVDMAELEACFDRVVTQLNAERASRSEIERLVARSRSGEQIIREHMLHMLITSPQVDEATLVGALDTLGISPVGRHITVVAFEVLGGDEKLAVVDLLPPAGMVSHAYVIDHAKGLFALLLEHDKTVPTSWLVQVVREVLNRLQREGCAHAAAGLAEEGTDRLADIGHQYEQARQALAHCLYQPPFSVQAYGRIQAPGAARIVPSIEKDVFFAEDDAPLETALAALREALASARRPDLAFYQRTFSRVVDAVDAVLFSHFRATDEAETFAGATVVEAIAAEPCLEAMMARLGAYCHDVRTMLRYENDVAMRQSIHRVVRYIQKNLAQPLTIAQLAGVAFLSPTYLCALFRQEMGETVNGFITKVRMERAKTLLCNPSMKQYDIAIAVGYANPSYFIRQFKKNEGITPAEYRNQHMVSGT